MSVSLSDLKRAFLLKMLGLTSSTLSNSDLESNYLSANIPESASLPLRSGQYYAPPTSSISASAGVNQRLVLAPIFIPNTIVVSTLTFETTVVAAPAGATFTPCVYADDGSGWPGALVGNTAAIDVQAAIGVKENAPTSTITLYRGWYWIGGLILGASTTPPTFRAQANYPYGGAPISTAANSTANIQGCPTATGLSSLPATFPTTVGTLSGSFAPRVTIKAA